MDILMHLIERDGPLCQGESCKRLLKIPDMRIDHIIPVKANGSTNDLSNLQILCHACNIKKGMNEDAEFVCVCDATTDGGNGNGKHENNAVIPTTAVKDTLQQDLAATHKEAPKVLDSAYMYVEKSEPVQVIVNDLESDKTRTATMKKADKCKGPWNRWLNEMLDNGEAYTYDEYAHAGANRFDCSEATIKRYMDDRLDAPDCNPIEGDLTFRMGPGGRLCVTWKDKERFYFK
jgi:hypothetical protein